MCVCAAMYWAGTGARRFPWPDDRRDPIRPVGSRLWETRSDSSGSVLAQFESRGGSEGVRSAPVRVRGRLYTWDAYGAAEGCLVVGVAQCGDQAFACNVEVRLPFLAVAARHPDTIPRPARPSQPPDRSQRFRRRADGSRRHPRRHREGRRQGPLRLHTMWPDTIPSHR